MGRLTDSEEKEFQAMKRNVSVSPVFRYTSIWASSKSNNLVRKRNADFLERLHPVVNGNDLVFGIKSTHLKKISRVEMICYLYGEIHLFHEFTFQTIPRSFTEFQAASGKFRVLVPPDEFIRYQAYPVSF